MAEETVSLDTLLYEDLVLLDVAEPSRDDLITLMANAAIDKGFATAGYAEDVIDREDQFPTGLPTEVMKVAMPHAMVQDHVLAPAIVIAKLAQPVDFKEMGDDTHDVPVEIVFMLVAKGDKSHLSILQRLICIFAEAPFMEQLAKADTPKELIDTLVRLSDEVEI